MKKLLLSHSLFLISILSLPKESFSQNVGIGTITPQSKLHIISAGDETIRLDANQPFISLYSNGVYKGYFWKSPNSIEIGSASGSGLPVTLAPDGIQRVFVTASGNVGIQNNNPNAPLSFPAFLGKKITLYPGGTGDVGFAVQGNLLQIYADHPNADIAFGYDQAGVFTERMRIKGNGNTGIGTNNPTEKLEIAGNIKASAFKFSTTKTYYYSVPPSAFRSASGSDVTSTSFASISFSSVPTPTGGLVAPVYLPQGAVVTSLTAYYYDNSPTTDIRIDLFDHFHGLGSGGLLASVISSGTPGEGNGIDNTILFSSVNNQILDYTLEASSTVGPWPVFIGLRSVVITYTLSEVY